MDTLSAGGFENLHFQIVPLKLAETVLLWVPAWSMDKSRRSINNARCHWLILKNNITSDISLTLWEELLQQLFDDIAWCIGREANGRGSDFSPWVWECTLRLDRALIRKISWLEGVFAHVLVNFVPIKPWWFDKTPGTYPMWAEFRCG
jgi:hypothetical protein